MKNSVLLRGFFIFILCIVFAAGLYAQDFGFGFGDDGGGDETVSGSRSGVSVSIGGETAVELAPYVHDFGKKDGEGISFWDMVSANVNFSVAAGNVDAYTAFNLNADALRELWDKSPLLNDPSYTPKFMDEAFLRAFIGPVNIEAGLRKLSWGKADSLGPLDVINPLDYTDLRNISDLQALKIARPLVHVTWNPGGFSKLEAVFIPNFAGHRFAREGRWVSSQFSDMADMVGKEIMNGLLPYMTMIPPEYVPLMSSMYSQFAGSFSPEFPDTSGLGYFQTGLRFTATVGPADIGAQYFYGNLFQPDVIFPGINIFIGDLINKNLPLFSEGTSPDPSALYTGNPALIYKINYNRYHQIGVDYAQVLSGFNFRAELALHLTEDLGGSDGAVRNPFIGWSLGFDRDLFWGINANIQCNETIRLFNGKVGNNPILDCEADTNLTSTRLTMRLSKKFLRDELESSATVIFDIENLDSYIIPALVWTIGPMAAELSAGVFVGNKDGDLGQYWENSFVKLGVKYTF